MSRYIIRLLLLLPILYSLGWTQIKQPYPPLNLVSIPTAGSLPRGSFTSEALLSKYGAFTPKLSVGITDNFSIGVSYPNRFSKFYTLI